MMEQSPLVGLVIMLDIAIRDAMGWFLSLLGRHPSYRRHEVNLDKEFLVKSQNDSWIPVIQYDRLW